MTNMTQNAAGQTRPLSITIGPLQYWWARPAMMAFYAEVAESAARRVVLGEVVCSRRNEYKFDDWVALARDLKSAGKEVVLATQALVMSEAELRTLRRIAEQDEFAVEAGDASALHVLWQAQQARPQRPGFTIGPHINVYSREALQEHAALGASCWVPPLELALDAIGRINPEAERVAGPAGPMQTEVFAFGRMPLAFSARCFTARHHRLNKDECEFRCQQDADGLLLKTSEGDAFLVLNGIQTQSAALHCVIGEGAALRAAGATGVRLSPCSRGFARVIALFDAVLNAGLPAAEALAELRALDLPGALVDGFALRQPGMAPLAA
ncbi:MAG: U32 family peptidase [Burkholderiales bacterium]|nr:U32 family peptidase [Burkholderiales bacterium]